MNPFEKDWKETPKAEPLPPETWGILELKGFTKLAGRVSEEERFGAKMGRIDVPMPDGSFMTKFFHGSSVHCCTFVSERVARHVARGSDAAPVGTWDFPRAIEHVGRAPVPELSSEGFETEYCPDCGEEKDDCSCEERDLEF